MDLPAGLSVPCPLPPAGEPPGPFPEDGENPAYLSRQIITYLGNKRALLGFIGRGVGMVRRRLGKARLSLFDVFSGSGIVARYFKRFSNLLLVNDLERYAELINRCYLSNRGELDLPVLEKIYGELMGELEGNPLVPGLITGLYAPEDDDRIQPGERVFYTRRNASYIDTARGLIDHIDEKYRIYFLAPLLSEASIHSNTSGVFKGFYKNRDTGVGQFGGRNRDSLARIRGSIRLPFPVFSNFDCDCVVYRGDSNRIARTAPEVDLAYMDPPYNQHPYGSNYFMLNLIIENKRPPALSRVSGIPEGWNRSPYNKRRSAARALADLAANIKAKYVLVSFNSEGIIPFEEMTELLKKIGRLEVLETAYNAFRGSRNLSKRGIHVKEYLFLVEK
ncbi:MAG: DNA adenine methylase [Treponema sp.]|jgi:adenine-specific DNA-methyltransferase|nr:DNA adenine methylase [Treponema sp.]